MVTLVKNYFLDGRKIVVVVFEIVTKWTVSSTWTLKMNIVKGLADILVFKKCYTKYSTHAKHFLVNYFIYTIFRSIQDSAKTFFGQIYFFGQKWFFRLKNIFFWSKMIFRPKKYFLLKNDFFDQKIFFSHKNYFCRSKFTS